MMSFQSVPEDEETVRREADRVAFLDSLPVAEQRARSRGTFFWTMDRVWAVQVLTIQDDWFKAIERSAEQGNRLYADTRSLQNLAHPMSQSESSSVTNTLQRRPTRFDLFQNSTAEKAHLGFSDASECHKAYGFLAQAATGINVGTATQRLKLLNGVKPTGAARRLGGCGLKHHKFNKMYLERQKDFYDGENPVMILVPIYTIGEVLNWNGTDEYYVMAITSPGQRGIKCSQRVLDAAPLTCSPHDVEVATNLLRCFCKAIACSARIHPLDESFEPHQLDYNSTPMTNLKKWWKYKKTELEADGATIRLPQLRSDIDWDNLKIARAKASRYNSLPDPFNLAVKAAINLSAMVGGKTMPACEAEWDDDGEEMCSVQDDETQWPPNPHADDMPSLLRSFGQVVN